MKKVLFSTQQLTQPKSNCLGKCVAHAATAVRCTVNRVGCSIQK